MCEEAIEPLKIAEKNETVFKNLKQVQTELIDKMNEKFGGDYYQLKPILLKNKYIKIECRLEHCPFDIWLKFIISEEGKCANLSVFRFIIQGHNPESHIKEYESKN